MASTACLRCGWRYSQNAITHLCRTCEKQTGQRPRSAAQLERDRLDRIAQRLKFQKEELPTPEPKILRTVQINGKPYDVVWDGSLRS